MNVLCPARIDNERPLVVSQGLIFFVPTGEAGAAPSVVLDTVHSVTKFISGPCSILITNPPFAVARFNRMIESRSLSMSGSSGMKILAFCKKLFVRRA